MGSVLVDLSQREQGRRVYDAICELASETKFIIKGTVIYLWVPSGIKGKQRALIRENRDALYCYLTTPPPIAGDCVRGHPRVWRITEYGVWLCSCYWNPSLLEPVLDSKKPALLNYWTRQV